MKSRITEGILINAKDNVVTMSRKVNAGDEIFWKQEGTDKLLIVNNEIPIFHKVACRKIEQGDYVIKYGHIIGIASKTIHKGDWVHIHNLKSPEKTTIHKIKEEEHGAMCIDGLDRMIKGYRRPDGKVGIRNHVLILPCSLCASETARFIAENVKGSIYLPNQGGCSLSNKDYEITMDTLSGIAANPNVYSTIVIGNGCEVIQAQSLVHSIKEKTNKPVHKFIIREEGGSLATVNKAVDVAKKMVADAAKEKLVKIDIREIMIGTECGGSDPTSGLVSNPVVGKVSDIIIAMGGSSILSETPEMIGAEGILASRAKTEKLEKEILQMIHEYEEDFIRVGENPRNGNPTPGNIVGGITTLEEKSLGCIHKAGESKVTELIHYAKKTHQNGLIVMDTPGQDIASIAGMVAAGAQVILFTTGHGTPTGFGIAPVIKVTGNEETSITMKDHIDFDCSNVLEGKSDIEQSGVLLYKLVLRICNGEKTKAEQLGFNDMSIARYCNFA